MKKNTTLALTVSLVLIVMTVCFGFNSSVLDDHSRQSLDNIIYKLDSLSVYNIHLSGHTDNTGPDNYNNKLSEERVIAVKNYLISKNIDSTKITFDFYGERIPAVPNTSEENRALNRRVEVTVSGQKTEPETLQIPPQITSPEAVKQDTTTFQKQETPVNASSEKKIKKKKVRRRLVWNGWRTGFHWSTSGR